MSLDAEGEPDPLCGLSDDPSVLWVEGSRSLDYEALLAHCKAASLDPAVSMFEEQLEAAKKADADAAGAYDPRNPTLPAHLAEKYADVDSIEV